MTKQYIAGQFLKKKVYSRPVQYQLETQNETR